MLRQRLMSSACFVSIGVSVLRIREWRSFQLHRYPVHVSLSISRPRWLLPPPRLPSPGLARLLSACPQVSAIRRPDGCVRSRDFRTSLVVEMGRRSSKIANVKGKADKARGKLYGRIGKQIVAACAPSPCARSENALSDGIQGGLSPSLHRRPRSRPNPPRLLSIVCLPSAVAVAC